LIYIGYCSISVLLHVLASLHSLCFTVRLSEKSICGALKVYVVKGIKE
jgi:hypothetical protein